MKKKLFVLFLAAVMVLSMSACGSSEDTLGHEENGNPETDPVSVYEELAEYYVFELEGAEYSLPCRVSDFTDNGWYIDPDLWVESGYLFYFNVFTDSSMDKAAFELGALNTSAEDKPVTECDVCFISLWSNLDCHSLTLKKAGVKIDISSKEALRQSEEDLKAAYGTDEGVFSEINDDDDHTGCWELRYMLNYSYFEDLDFLDYTEFSSLYSLGDYYNIFRLYIDPVYRLNE